MNYNQIAEVLDSAALNARAVSQISESRYLNLEEAYAVQSISLMRRYQRGEQRVGLKLGFTSKAKMKQMGIHDMIWGRLTDAMHYSDGADLRKSDYIHPRAEPEIAFRVAKKIDREVTLESAWEYIKSVAVAIEIIDSRYQNFKFSLEDVVADNCSSAGFVHGDWLPGNTEIRDLEMTLSAGGSPVHIGNSNAILGNPLESFTAAARLARENGEVLSEDDIILAGAATPAIYIEAGQTIEASAAGLGKVSLRII